MDSRKLRTAGGILRNKTESRNQISCQRVFLETGVFSEFFSTQLFKLKKMVEKNPKKS